MAKGDVLAVAQVAGVMAAKRTPDLIPLCHPLPITGVDMAFDLDVERARLEIRATVRVTGRTGVEMEALTAAVGGGVDGLRHVQGGRSRDERFRHIRAAAQSRRQERRVRAADDSPGHRDRERQGVARRARGRGRAGHSRDAARPAACAFAEVDYRVVPDEEQLIAEALFHLSERADVDLILTTGGTGLAPRDVTPQATLRSIDYEVPGIAEAMRAASLQVTPMGMLSRGVAGVRKRTLIVNLPGNPKAVRENLWRRSRRRCRTRSTRCAARSGSTRGAASFFPRGDPLRSRAGPAGFEVSRDETRRLWACPGRTLSTNTQIKERTRPQRGVLVTRKSSTQE